MVEKTSKVELIYLAELNVLARTRRRLGCWLFGHQQYGPSYVIAIEDRCRRCGRYAR